MPQGLRKLKLPYKAAQLSNRFHQAFPVQNENIRKIRHGQYRDTVRGERSPVYDNTYFTKSGLVRRFRGTEN